jgi:triacylglycerol lipase
MSFSDFKDRALECGRLVQAAYKQFDGLANAIPADYTILNMLWTIEEGQHEPFGFVALKTTAGLSGNIYRDVFIVFRGTRTTSEWVFDIEADQVDSEGGGKVARGFGTLYDQVRAQILEALSGLASGYNLFIMGHSLGGPVALCCAKDLKRAKPITFTFNSPRAFDAVAAAAVTGLMIYRIFNTEDIVPSVPLAAPLIGPQYIHVGESVALTYNTGNIDQNHSLDRLMVELQKYEK